MPKPTLDELIANYLVAIDAGEEPERERLMADHPEHADGLNEFFADFDRMRGAVERAEDEVTREFVAEDEEQLVGSLSQTEGSSLSRLSDKTQQRLERLLQKLKMNQAKDARPGKTTASSLKAEASRVIDGKYKLLQQIGSGGMGEVWMAEQEKPVRRRVALKLIKTGMDTKEVVARFEAERQALAMMDHQHIAKVLDGGSTEQGRPYFVMELVQGIPITKYCDKNKLSVNERLNLFIPVCNAVQHAHQKGIIHRDLKPSNILVTLYDGRPVAKVIDFGLAKALQHQARLTDKTLFTEFGQVVGTLQYMSPEQAEMNALDIDTRTDIYSLGVILYELLTGSTPIDRDTLDKHAIYKVLEAIRETDPPRPSIRLSSSGDAITGISQQRKIEPKKLTQILRGDLDWIVMKALEKDRTRRYESASGLSTDVERYINGDEVSASPPSKSYRLRKFVGKHKTLVSVSSLVFLLLASATGIAFRFAIIAEEKAKQNEMLAAEKTQLASENEGIAKKERGLRIEQVQLSTELAQQKLSAIEDKCKSFLEMGLLLYEEGQQDRGCDLICKAVTELPEDHHLKKPYMRILQSRLTREGFWTKPVLEHTGSVYQGCFNPTGTVAITRGFVRTGNGNTIGLRCWNVATGSLLGQVARDEASCSFVLPSPTENTMLVFFDDGVVERWGLQSVKRLETLSDTPEIEVRYAINSPNGQFIAGYGLEDGGKQRGFYVDLEEGQWHRWEEEMGLEGRLAFTPDSLNLLVAGYGVIRSLDVTSQQSDYLYESNAGTIDEYDGLTSNNKGAYAAVGGGYRLDLLEASGDGSRLIISVDSKALFNQVRFSPDGKTLAASTTNGLVQLFNVETGSKEGEIVVYDEIVTFKFFPDANWLAVMTGSHTLRFFDVRSSEEILTPLGHLEMSGFEICPDGSHVLTQSDELTLARLWDVSAATRGVDVIDERAIVNAVQSPNVGVSEDAKFWWSSDSEDGELSLQVFLPEASAPLQWESTTESYAVYPVGWQHKDALVFRDGDKLTFLNLSNQPPSTEHARIDHEFDYLEILPVNERCFYFTDKQAGEVVVTSEGSVVARPLLDSGVLESRVKVSPTKRAIAFISADGQCVEFDLSTSELHVVASRDSGLGNQLVDFAYMDGEHLVIQFQETLQLRSRDGNVIAGSPRYRWWIESMAVSADGSCVAACYVDGRVATFDAHTLEPVEETMSDGGKLYFWGDSETLVQDNSEGGAVYETTTLTRLGQLCFPETLYYASRRSNGGFSLVDAGPNREHQEAITYCGGVPYVVAPDEFLLHSRLIESKKFTRRFREAKYDLEFDLPYQAGLADADSRSERLLHVYRALQSRFRPDFQRVISRKQHYIVAVGLAPDWFSASQHCKFLKNEHVAIYRADLLHIEASLHIGDNSVASEALATIRQRAWKQEDASIVLSILRAANSVIWPEIAEPNQDLPSLGVSTLFKNAIDLALDSELRDRIGTFVNTLGVLQYRRNQFEESLETLALALSLNPHRTGAIHSVDLAFLSLVHLRLGNETEAEGYRSKFEEVLEHNSALKDDEELVSIRKEIQSAFMKSDD